VRSVKAEIVPIEVIENKIYLIRGQKVMLDRDLALLYGVKTKVFNQAVKRNVERFPEDFMFRLTAQENENLRSQIVTSRYGGTRYFPYVFTEHGIAMLSSVLNSKRAVRVNIQIMRAFIKLRQVLSAHKELAAKLAELEKKYEGHDEAIRHIFSAIRQLMSPPVRKKKRIGFLA
jgi:hypothetical protein